MEIDDKTIELLREIRDKSKEFMDDFRDLGMDGVADQVQSIKRSVITGILSTEVSKAIQKLDEELEGV